MNMIKQQKQDEIHTLKLELIEKTKEHHSGLS